MINIAGVERVEKYDVVVCGAGPSGVAAAIQAARGGLSVAIIERHGCFGGNMTSGAVCHLLGGRRWDDKNCQMVREVGGIFDEITDRLILEGSAVDPDHIDVNNNPYGWYPRMAAGIPCDIEALKYLLDKMIIENGVSPYLFTNLVDVYVESNILERIIAHDQSGFIVFEAETFIDATGDAQLTHLCGCPTIKGRNEDHLMTPATLIMHVDNVDMEKYVAYQNLHFQPKLINIINDLRSKGIWDFPFEIFIAVQLNDKDVSMVNTVRQIGVDGTDAYSLTNAMIEGRALSQRLLKIMRAHFPGFENARIRFTANTIGIRETRRIDGRTVTTLSDALKGKRYEDEVLKTTYNFDLPDPKRPSYDPMLGSVENPNVVREHVAIYAPYTALLPRGVDNIVVCGRCVSVEREVLGPMRVSGPAMLSGQAAGVASIIANKKQQTVAQVDGSVIKEKLVSMKCII